MSKNILNVLAVLSIPVGAIGFLVLMALAGIAIYTALFG